MNILCIGDIVGKAGREVLENKLPEIKKRHKIDLTIANAENIAGGSGITPRTANQLFRLGCDVLTLGDHVWDRTEGVSYLEETENILRPANFPEGNPGKGSLIFTTKEGKKVGIINLLGRVFIRYNINCPFLAFRDLVSQLKQETNIIVVDFHAEATSEKIAFGHYADGQVSAVVGSHTHVQTADETILPKGTAYITDLGMTGPFDSVIGQNKDKIIRRFLTSIPERFEVAKGDPRINGAVLEIDDNTGLACKIIRIQESI